MIEFKIPTFANENWDELIEKTDGANKILLLCYARAIEVVEQVDKNANPQSFAWMIIWTHIFATLQGTQAAAEKGSELTLNFLGRSSSELELILFAISSAGQKSSPDSQHTTSDRLAAYSAWCLWNDIKAQDRRLERRNLDAIWDDSDAHKIAKDPDELEMYENFFGKLEFEDPKEAKTNRLEYEERIWHLRTKLENMANHSELKPWIKKLETRAKERNWIRSYFELIGESEKSIRQRLIKLDAAQAYSIYEEQSLLIHASTFDNLFSIHNDIAYPRIKTPPHIIESLTQSIASTCNSNILLLVAISEYI